MNENINLCEILKGHEGEVFYSPVLGNVTLTYINYPNIGIKTINNIIFDISYDGKMYR